MAFIPGITTAGRLGGTVLGITGVRFPVNSEAVFARASGSHTPIGMWAGKVTMNGGMDWLLSDDELVVLNYIIPAGTPRALPVFTATIGTYQFTGCKAKSLKIDGTVGETIKASLDFEAMALAPDTNPILGNKNVFDGINLTSSGLGALSVVSFSVGVDVGVSPIHTMNATGARVPVFLAEGDFAVKLNLKLAMAETIPANISAAVLAPIASATLAVRSTAAIARVLTITFTNILPSAINRDLSPKELLYHGLDYEAQNISFTIA